METEQDLAKQAAIEKSMQEAWDRIEGLRVDEVSCMYKPSDLAAKGPNEGIVEVGSNPSTHPLRKGRIRIPTASEIAEITDPVLGQPIIDNVVLRSVSSMDGGE